MKYRFCFLLIPLVLLLLLYLFFMFEKIEVNNEPFLSKKEDCMKVFHENKKYFDYLRKSDATDYFYKFTPGQAEQQLYEMFDVETADVILYLVNNAGMTDFTKTGGSILIYQVKPVLSSDIRIGMRYMENSGKWEYYYFHDYKRCIHSHKVTYFIYDVLFNGKNQWFVDDGEA